VSAAFEVLALDCVEVTAFARDTYFAQSGFAVERRSNSARSQSHCRHPRFIAVPDWLEITKALDGKASAAGFNSCLRGEAIPKAPLLLDCAAADSSLST
jgi:hypothetical protein